MSLSARQRWELLDDALADARPEPDEKEVLIGVLIDIAAATESGYRRALAAIRTAKKEVGR
jgi:hypothetical protein